MVSKSVVRYAIISPKKVWRVAREIQGMSYKGAMEILREITPKAARVLEKGLKSAFYNALQKDSNLSEEDLYLNQVFVTKGPSYKRVSPRAQGRADVVKKRTSHVNVVLATKGEN